MRTYCTTSVTVHEKRLTKLSWKQYSKTRAMQSRPNARDHLSPFLFNQSEPIHSDPTNFSPRESRTLDLVILKLSVILGTIPIDFINCSEFLGVGTILMPFMLHTYPQRTATSSQVFTDLLKLPIQRVPVLRGTLTSLFRIFYRSNDLIGIMETQPTVRPAVSMRSSPVAQLRGSFGTQPLSSRVKETESSALSRPLSKSRIVFLYA